MIPLLAINSVPIFVVGTVWWTHRKDDVAIPQWRRAVFLTALVASTLSSISLLGFLLGTLSGTLNAHASGVVLLAMLGIGLLSAVLAVFGNRISRWLLIANGLLLVVCWYMAGMATSV